MPLDGYNPTPMGYVLWPNSVRVLMCGECAAKSGVPRENWIPVFHENIDKYQQDCHGPCGKRLHEGNKGWPQLYDKAV